MYIMWLWYLSDWCKCCKYVFWICLHWYLWIRNRSNRQVISQRRHALFGHIQWLPADTAAHKVLHMAVWSVFVSQHFIWAFSSVLHLRHRLANSQRVAVGMHYEKVGWRMGSYVRDTRSITDQLRKKCKQLRLWNVDCSLNRKQPQHNAMLSNNEVNLYPCGTAISLSYHAYLLHQIAEFTIPTVIQRLVFWKSMSTERKHRRYRLFGSN